MPQSHIQYPPDGTGKRARTYQRGAAATDPHDTYVIVAKERITSNELRFATFRTVASAAASHNLLTIENTTGSAVMLAIQELVLEVQVTAVTAMLVAAEARLFRTTTAPTGGTVLTAHPNDTGDPAIPANIVVRGATASDGGVATAITLAAPATSPISSQAIDKTLSGVGQYVTDEAPLITTLAPALILRAGQTALVQVNGIIPAHYHYILRGQLEVFTTP